MSRSHYRAICRVIAESISTLRWARSERTEEAVPRRRVRRPTVETSGSHSCSQVGGGQQVMPVAQLRCARSCRGKGACRVQRVPQVTKRCYVQRLGPERSHKGQGTVRRHSTGTNIVDHPEATTVRGGVERGGTERGAVVARA